MIPIDLFASKLKLSLDIQTKTQNLIRIKVNYKEYVYEAVSKKVKGDIIIVIKGKVCHSKERFYDLQEQYGQNHFQAQVYEFQELYQYFVELQKLVRELNEQIFDDKTKTKITKLQSEITPQESDSQIVSETIENQNKQDSQQENNQIDQPFSVIQSLLDKHEIETDQLQQYNPSIIHIENLSKAKPLTQSCYFCQQSITNNIIQINCGHSYHSQCLSNLIQAEIQQNTPLIYCLCNMKQSLGIVKLLDNDQWGKNLINQLLNIQLKTIITNNHNILRRCPNQYCYFVFLYNQQFGKQTYCPLCLQTYDIV